MKKPNTPSKWNSDDKSRAPLASVPASDPVDKTGAKITNLPARNAGSETLHSAPADDDKRESKR